MSTNKTKLIKLTIEVFDDTNESVYVNALTHVVHGTLDVDNKDEIQFRSYLCGNTIDIEQTNG